MRKAGVIFHPVVQEARQLGMDLARLLEARGYQVWSASAWAEDEVKHLMPGTGAVITVGGDGTILRAARAIIPEPCPILGIRYGRLGFLGEIEPAEALVAVPPLLEAPGVLEERVMLRARWELTKVDPELPAKHHPLMNGDPSFHALNEVVIARGSAGRPIYVEVFIDRQPCITYRADGVAVSTATGSTGYSLSVGGPVLHPESRCFVVSPMAAHATLSNPFVLEPGSEVRLKVHSDHGAVMSVDGQVDVPLTDGDTVTVDVSPYRARFIRLPERDTFYTNLLKRLQFGESSAPDRYQSPG